MSVKDIISQLLYRSESETLDFKSEQYKFVKSDDINKAEILKDIIAFANAWRDSDAYILIGVQEKKGLKALVKGISTDSDNIDDAQLQEFVNLKVNRPIKFSYQTTEIENKIVALITIPAQKGPFFLKKKFAKLDADTVYIRRGSSTAIAPIEEIAEMGSYYSRIENKKTPKLKAFIVDDEHEEIPLSSIDKSVILADIPKEFPLYGATDKIISTLPTLSAINLSLFSGSKNKDYYSEFADYFKEIKSIFSIKFGVTNYGNLVAKGVRAEVEFKNLPNGSIIFHGNELPEPPKAESCYMFDSTLNNINLFLNIDNILGGYRANVDFGKVQTKDSTVCSESIVFKIPCSCQILANVTIFSDELESPEKMDLVINVNVEEKDYSVKDIIKIC